MRSASSSIRGIPFAPPITIATIPNEIASAHSAASTLAPATTRPPKSGPKAAQAVKPKLRTAFPSRSIPGEVRIAPTEARVSARAEAARAPSIAASTITAAKMNSCASRARAVNATASSP